MKGGRIGVPIASLCGILGFWVCGHDTSLQVFSGVTYILLQGSPAHSCEEYITVAYISEYNSDRYAEDDSSERI